MGQAGAEFLLREMEEGGKGDMDHNLCLGSDWSSKKPALLGTIILIGQNASMSDCRRQLDQIYT